MRLGEVNFFNDVARDFLLLQEMDYKKIVLIGPRSSTNGLFHGPLWTYINYPAYVIGNGDPVFVAWFWIMLESAFLVTGFFMMRKMFDVLSALAFTALVSTLIASHINGVFHAEATIFFMPMLLFTIYMYVKSKNIKYLIFHLLSLSLIIQLEIGIGIQFFILSLLFIAWSIIKNKLWKHFAVFLVIPVLLSNFIIFDLRNDLRMTKAILLTGGSFKFFITISSWLQNRFNNTVSLQLFNNKVNDYFVYIVFLLVLICTFLVIRNKNKNKNIYILFLYYYFGYMVLSFFNKGILLFHYVYLLIPLAVMWLTSFLSTRYKIIFAIIVGIIFYQSFISSYNNIKSRETRSDKNYNSWKSLSAVAQNIINERRGKEFGYFVYTPDALAYQPRYAMIYNFKQAHAKSLEYVKKSVTYIIAAPPPPDNPYMSYNWWVKVSLGIKSNSSLIKKFPNGFTIEKFNLTSEDQRIPHDKAIEIGIHFR